MASQAAFEKRRAIVRASKADSVFFANQFLSKKPHPGQIEWLRGSTQPINVLVPGNRWGKSTVIAMKHIWKCVFRVGQSKTEKAQGDPYETISVAMSADQAEIVFREAKRLLSTKGLRPLVKAFRSSPFPHIIFTNGSVMHCRSSHDDGKYIDGHRYMYLSIDEAGWISNLRHLMTNVILMRLAGGGEIDLIGTPKGYNDLYFYFERGQRGISGYYSQRGSIYDNPFLPKEDIMMRDKLLMSADPKMRQQVLYGDFVDFTGLAFTRDQRDNAFDPALREHVKYKEGQKYVAAWDLGRTTDFTVGIVLDITRRPWHLVSYTRLNRVSWEEIYATIERVAKEYHLNYSTIDATGPQGDIIEEELTKRGTMVYGYKSSTKSLKVELINNLQTALDEGRTAVDFVTEVDENEHTTVIPVLQDPGTGWGLLRLPTITQLMDEMGVYSLDDKDIPFTDSVMSLALAVNAAYEAEGLTAPVVGSVYGPINRHDDDIEIAGPKIGLDKDYMNKKIAETGDEFLVSEPR
jgi:hypothetical protein